MQNNLEPVARGSFHWVPMAIQDLYVKGGIGLKEKEILSTIIGLESCEGVCWATDNYITHRTRIEEKTLQRYMKMLRKKGFIRSKSVNLGGRVGIRRLICTPFYFSVPNAPRKYESLRKIVNKSVSGDMKIATLKNEELGVFATLKNEDLLPSKMGVNKYIGEVHNLSSASASSSEVGKIKSKKLNPTIFPADGFIPAEEIEPDKKWAVELSNKLYHSVQSKTPPNTKPKTWPKFFLQALRDPNYGKERIERALSAHCKNWKAEYWPKAYSAKNFVESISRIEDALTRLGGQGRTGAATDPEKPMPGAKEALRRLSGKSWPAGCGADLERFISESIRKSIRFRKAMRTIVVPAWQEIAARKAGSSTAPGELTRSTAESALRQFGDYGALCSTTMKSEHFAVWYGEQVFAEIKAWVGFKGKGARPLGHFDWSLDGPYRKLIHAKLSSHGGAAFADSVWKSIITLTNVN